jgi:hypothetical protein
VPARVLIRRVVAILSTLAAFGLAAWPASAAHAAPVNCAQAVIDDWYGDSQVDKRYAPHCYRDAIASLSPDQKDYLHAEEDILRALAYAKAGKQDPGPAGARARTPQGTVVGQPKSGPSTREGSKTQSDTTVAVDDVPSSGASGIPLPLILLGSLAVTLLVAGGAGMLSRRLRASSDNDAD